MKFRLAVLLIGVSFALQAQIQMTVVQLEEMVRSSISMKYDDRQIAEYLKTVRLTEKLDDRTIETLAGQGAGPRTVRALDVLRDETANLKKPTAQELQAAVKPKYIPPPPPDSVKQKEILSSMHDYASSYTQSLPNFICAQVTRRYAARADSDTFHLMDTVTAKLSYNGGHEDYKVIFVNDKAVDTTIEKLGGAVSEGEFGSLLKSVFAGHSEADFGWDHWATLRGKRMAVFNYAIDSAHSDYTLDYAHEQKIITAYKGLIYGDEYTGEVTRVTFEAVDIPPAFPIRQASTILDYDEVPIGDSSYVVPLKAEIRMRTGEYKSRNDIEFRLYKKFGTESTITFAPAALPDSKTTEQPAGGTANPPPPPVPPQ